MECVTDAAKELGYPEMKLEQLEVRPTIKWDCNTCIKTTGIAKRDLEDEYHR